jgi:hypothetical protein
LTASPRPDVQPYAEREWHLQHALLVLLHDIAAAVASEAALESLEARHICPEMALAEILEQERIKAGELQPKELGKDLLN